MDPYPHSLATFQTYSCHPGFMPLVFRDLGDEVVEFPALSHLSQGTWVQTSVRSRDFLIISTSPLPQRVPYGW